MIEVKNLTYGETENNFDCEINHEKYIDWWLKSNLPVLELSKKNIIAVSVISWEIKWIPQDNEKATYCKKIEKENWKIDFENETVTQIYNKFRAYNPWPWIYTFYNEKKFDITDCFFEENDIIFDEDFKLWDVVEFEDHWKNSIWILCNWGILILNKVKLEWKKEMPIKDFLNWNKDFLDYNFIFYFSLYFIYYFSIFRFNINTKMKIIKKCYYIVSSSYNFYYSNNL